MASTQTLHGSNAQSTIPQPAVVTSIVHVLALAALVGLVAAIPRLWGLADFFTTDEAYHWIERTGRFSAAIGDGVWAQTRQTGHPGVTLMWLGSAGLALERAAVGLGWIAPPTPIEHLAWLRLVPALAHAVVVSLSFVLLRRLVRPQVALIAALLWATSPYLVAHGRLLHLDALLTDFATLTMLLTLLACQSPRPLRWMFGAGVCAGLALLTKGPALILLPSVGLLLCQVAAPRWTARVWRIGTLYLVWLAVALLVVALLWPALWVTPASALQDYVNEIVGNGGRANGDGQFFWGQAVADPGLLFYPLANLFRLTPLALVGCLLLPLTLWRTPAERRVLLSLGAFVLFWTLVMSLGPKKFDRYVLPTWPALLVLAAAGLAALADASTRLWQRRTNLVSVAVVLVCQVPLLVWYQPYYLSYYNPLLGGGAVAQRLFLVGWGEGMDQVGAYLRTRPDIVDGMVLSALPPTLQPFLPVPVRNVTTIDVAPANYAVVYRESIQRGAFPAIYQRIQQTVPLQQISIHGIDYATIYQLPKPFDQPIDAQFGDGLHLRGIRIDEQPGTLTITPSWDVRGPLAADYLVFVHLLDANGQRIAQIDASPGGTALPPTTAWQPGEQIAVPLPIGLPNLPAGAYRVVLGIYDPATGARLPLMQGTPADPTLAGPDALLITTLRLEPDTNQ